MPEAGERPHDEQVAKTILAAEGDVDVVAEERRQRDVPTAPEVNDRAGDVRVIEVLVVVEAEHEAEADGHVRIAREVEVDLQRVRDEPEPALADGERAEIAVHVLVDELTGDIGYAYLLEEAHAHARHAAREVAGQMEAVLDLVRDVDVADDGARDELVKQAHEHHELDPRALRAHVAAIDVDDVRDRLERVERDADGQREAWRPEVRSGRAVERLDDEAAVLEHGEQRDVRRHGRGQRERRAARPPRPLDQSSGEIVERG